MATHVIVHIYDLGPACVELNMLGRAVGTGAFHAGVEVYGLEYSFAPCGVCHFPPRACPHHIYRESIPMGRTQMSKQEVDALIRKLMREWPGPTYDILEHNCCHFSNELCNRLGVGSLPEWVTSLADVGAELRNLPQAFQNLAINGMEAILDWWQVPQQLTDDIHIRQRRPRKKTEKDHVYPKGHPLRTVYTEDAPGEESCGEFRVKEWIEVYSNTYKVWCKGQVKQIVNKDPIGEIIVVAFRTPGARIHEICFKDLPLGSKDLRKAKEVRKGKEVRRVKHGGCC